MRPGELQRLGHDPREGADLHVNDIGHQIGAVGRKFGLEYVADLDRDCQLVHLSR